MLESVPGASAQPIDAVPQQSALLSRRSRFAREVVDTLLLTAMIFLIVNTATSRFTIRSVSMEPTLREGEYVIVDKVSYLLHPPERGDIVVLAIPSEKEDLIKRVIGLPGETISVLGGVATVDGRALTESYATPGGPEIGPRVLGPDEFFVMGDNRGNSKDSRAFGPIRRDNIVGRAWIIYWPPSDWSIVPHQAYAEGN